MPLPKKNCRLLDESVACCPLKTYYISYCLYSFECDIRRNNKCASIRKKVKFNSIPINYTIEDGWIEK